MDNLNQIIVTTPDTLRNIVTDAVAEALSASTTSHQSEPALLSGAALAAKLGLSRTSVHRLRLAGAPAVRVGDTYKFSAPKVMQWLETRGQGVAS